ncbi:hypothetical protein DSM07_10400 [Oenococcus sp. UCMA 16435]|nr:hypothetical protein DSM07_10400 [Oenococcus sp. UCMA 16435]
MDSTKGYATAIKQLMRKLVHYFLQLYLQSLTRQTGTQSMLVITCRIPELPQKLNNTIIASG